MVEKGGLNKNKPSTSQQNTEEENEKKKDPIGYKESESKIEKQCFSFQFANRDFKSNNFHSFQCVGVVIHP